MIWISYLEWIEKIILICLVKQQRYHIECSYIIGNLDNLCMYVCTFYCCEVYPRNGSNLSVSCRWNTSRNKRRYIKLSLVIISYALSLSIWKVCKEIWCDNKYSFIDFSCRLFEISWNYKIHMNNNQYENSWNEMNHSSISSRHDCSLNSFLNQISIFLYLCLEYDNGYCQRKSK